MKFFNKNKGKIAGGIILAVILVFAFWWGGDTPDDHGFSEPTHTPVAMDAIETAEPTVSVEPTPTTSPTAKPAITSAPTSSPAVAVPTETPTERTTCTLSIRCDTILSNIASLDSTKTSIVPQNGVIYGLKTVEFTEGESAFDVLLRETRRMGIHLSLKSPPFTEAHI